MERYAAYKDSGVEWIGEIPEGWTKSKLKYIGNYINGFAFKPSDWSSVGLPIIRIQDLTGSSDSPNYYSGEIDKRYLVNPGDLLVSWAATIGAFRWRGDIAWLNQHIFKAQMNEAVCQKSYAYWLLSASIDELDHENKHGIMMAHLTGSVFNNFEVVLPPIVEQKAISSYLDKKTAEIDEIVGEVERSIGLLREYRKSVISEAVTKGLNPDVPMKDSGIDWIGEIPESWQIEPLKYQIDAINSGTSVNGANYPAEKGWYGVLKTSAVYHDAFTPSENKSADADEVERLSCPVEKDSVIVSRMNTPEWVGAAGYVAEDYPSLYLPDRLWQIKTKSSLLAKYLWYYLQFSGLKSWISVIAVGTSGSMKNISQGEFGNITCVFPQADEQQVITDYLDAKTAEIDSLVDDKEKQVELLKEHRKSLISEAVTGKFKVPGLE